MTHRPVAQKQSRGAESTLQRKNLQRSSCSATDSKAPDSDKSTKRIWPNLSLERATHCAKNVTHMGCHVSSKLHALDDAMQRLPTRPETSPTRWGKDVEVCECHARMGTPSNLSDACRGLMPQQTHQAQREEPCAEVETCSTVSERMFTFPRAVTRC